MKVCKNNEMFTQPLHILILILGLHLFQSANSPKKIELKKKLFFFNLARRGRTYQRNCSVSRSAIVQKVLLQEFTPIYEKYSFDVPLSCPLKLEKSYHYSLEQSKSEHFSGWKCEICGKRFYAEQFVYKHIQHKHAEDVIKYERDSICLADYCDVFRCDLHEKYPIVRSDFPECNHKRIREIQRKCEKLINRCLPNNAMRHHVYDALQKSLCGSLNCEMFYTSFEDLSLGTVILLVLLVPSVVIMSYFVCCCIWEKYVEGDDDRDGDEKTAKKKKTEQSLRAADARNAAMRNRGMQSHYHSYNLRRR